jgi:hypothetical protein
VDVHIDVVEMEKPEGKPGEPRKGKPTPKKDGKVFPVEKAVPARAKGERRVVKYPYRKDVNPELMIAADGDRNEFYKYVLLHEPDTGGEWDPVTGRFHGKAHVDINVTGDIYQPTRKPKAPPAKTGSPPPK